MSTGHTAQLLAESEYVPSAHRPQLVHVSPLGEATSAAPTAPSLPAPHAHDSEPAARAKSSPADAPLLFRRPAST